MKRLSVPFCICTLLTFAVSASASPVAQLQNVEKPLHHPLGSGDSRDIIEVKFLSDDVMQQQQGRWRSARLGGQPALDALMGGSGPVSRAEPLFDAAVLQMARGNDLPALHQWFRLHLRPGAAIVDVVDALNAMAVVELAYPAPLPVHPHAGVDAVTVMPALPRQPMASPLLEERQIYALPAAQGGIDAVHARTVEGGDGRGVRVVDMEFGWDWQHEDLTKLRVPGTWIRNGGGINNPYGPDHGTAVMGQMVADKNGFGVRGLVDAATPHYVNVIGVQNGFSPANALMLAANKLRPGDVILMEIQVTGPGRCNNYVPGEWVGSVYDAVVSAVKRGIHVVQAAGNGSMNLDYAPCFGRSFPRGLPDSGAIMVGAGAPWPSRWCRVGQPPRSRLGFSTFGRRVNVQGVGQCVTTTGYGDLWRAPHAQYTRVFSGTSSSSPIVASAVVAISGAAKARGITVTPEQMRKLLIETGTPQNGTNGHIGPLPNLRAALDRL